MEPTAGVLIAGSHAAADKSSSHGGMPGDTSSDGHLPGPELTG